MTRPQRAILRAAAAFIVARNRYYDLDDEIGDTVNHPRVRQLERLRERSQQAEERLVQLVRNQAPTAELAARARRASLRSGIHALLVAHRRYEAAAERLSETSTHILPIGSRVIVRRDGREFVGEVTGHGLAYAAPTELRLRNVRTGGRRKAYIGFDQIIKPGGRRA